MSGVQDIEQVQQVYTKYANLTEAMQRLVLNDPTVKNASPRLLDIWHYTNRFIGATGFVYHAAQVARMCGLVFHSADAKRDFRRHQLDTHGIKGLDWDNIPKSEVFPGLFGEKSRLDNFENSMVLPVPGSTTGETVTITPGTNATKFPMLTEKFARRLILRCGQKGLDKDYAEFLLAMNDIVVKVATGQYMQSEEQDQQPRGTKRPATWQEELEYQERMEELKLKKARRDAEEAQLRQIQAENFFKMMAAYGGDESDRDKIHRMDYQRNIVFSIGDSLLQDIRGGHSQMQSGQPVHTIMDAEPAQREITISEVALRLLGRPARDKELPKFGMAVSKLYFAKYGTKPPKRNQFVDGAPRQVNSYTTKDLDLLEQGIHQCIQ